MSSTSLIEAVIKNGGGHIEHCNLG